MTNERFGSVRAVRAAVRCGLFVVFRLVPAAVPCWV